MEPGGTRFAHPRPLSARDEAGDELPDVAAAEEEEDDREEAQQSAGEDLGDGARGREGAGGELRLMVAQRVDDGVAGLVDLVAAEVGGPVDEPGARTFDAAGHLV